MKIFPEKENRKVQSKVSLKFIQHTSKLGLAHTLLCVACSFGFVILWLLFLKPTHLDNKIEIQGAMLYKSVVVLHHLQLLPASQHTDRFHYSRSIPCFCYRVQRTTRTFAPKKNDEKYEFLQRTGRIVNRQNHDSNIP